MLRLVSTYVCITLGTPLNRLRWGVRFGGDNNGQKPIGCDTLPSRITSSAKAILCQGNTPSRVSPGAKKHCSNQEEATAHYTSRAGSFPCQDPMQAGLVRFYQSLESPHGVNRKENKDSQAPTEMLLRCELQLTFHLWPFRFLYCVTSMLNVALAESRSLPNGRATCPA